VPLLNSPLTPHRHCEAIRRRPWQSPSYLRGDLWDDNDLCRQLKMRSPRFARDDSSRNGDSRWGCAPLKLPHKKERFLKSLSISLCERERIFPPPSSSLSPVSNQATGWLTGFALGGFQKMREMTITTMPAAMVMVKVYSGTEVPVTLNMAVARSDLLRTQLSPAS
jgi:hypothetical protein